jgi:hypothetical protein
MKKKSIETKTLISQVSKLCDENYEINFSHYYDGNKYNIKIMDCVPLMLLPKGGIHTSQIFLAKKNNHKKWFLVCIQLENWNVHEDILIKSEKMILIDDTSKNIEILEPNTEYVNISAMYKNLLENNFINRELMHYNTDEIVDEGSMIYYYNVWYARRKAQKIVSKKLSDNKLNEKKSTDTKSTDTKSTDTKTTDTKTTDTKTTDTKTTDIKSTDTKSTDTKSTDIKSSDTKSEIKIFGVKKICLMDVLDSDTRKHFKINNREYFKKYDFICIEIITNGNIYNLLHSLQKENIKKPLGIIRMCAYDKPFVAYFDKKNGLKEDKFLESFCHDNNIDEETIISDVKNIYELYMRLTNKMNDFENFVIY